MNIYHSIGLGIVLLTIAGDFKRTIDKKKNPEIINGNSKMKKD